MGKHGSAGVAMQRYLGTSANDWHKTRRRAIAGPERVSMLTVPHVLGGTKGGLAMEISPCTSTQGVS